MPYKSYFLILEVLLEVFCVIANDIDFFLIDN